MFLSLEDFLFKYPTLLRRDSAHVLVISICPLCCLRAVMSQNQMMQMAITIMMAMLITPPAVRGVNILLDLFINFLVQEKGSPLCLWLLTSRFGLIQCWQVQLLESSGSWFTYFSIEFLGEVLCCFGIIILCSVFAYLSPYFRWVTVGSRWFSFRVNYFLQYLNVSLLQTFRLRNE